MQWNNYIIDNTSKIVDKQIMQSLASSCMHQYVPCMNNVEIVNTYSKNKCLLVYTQRVTNNLFDHVPALIRFQQIQQKQIQLLLLCSVQSTCCMQHKHTDDWCDHMGCK